MGVVARWGSGVACCYFFRSAGGDDTAPASLDPVDAAAVLRVDDAALSSGSWPITGKVANWSRARWSMPRFGVHWPGLPVASLARYSDEDAAVHIDSEPVDLDNVGEFPNDQVFSPQQVVLLLDSRSLDDAIEDPAHSHATQRPLGAREVRAFFLCRDDAHAGALAKTLDNLGWNARLTQVEKSSAPEEFTVLLIASRDFPEPPEENELALLRASMEESAELHGAEMDGWELEV